MNKHHKIHVRLKKPFPNLFRGRHVLIACKDPEGKILLGTKHGIYPKGIYRLLGGGIDEDENPITAAIREVEEELKVKAEESDITLLTEIAITAEAGEQEFNLTTYLYLLNLKTNNYGANDDVSEVTKVGLGELLALADKYENLDGEFFYKWKGKTESWFWEDYGKVYGPIHRIAYEELKARFS